MLCVVAGALSVLSGGQQQQQGDEQRILDGMKGTKLWIFYPFPTATAGGRGTDIGRYESHKSMDIFILFSSQTGKEGITFCRKKSQGFLL